MLFGDYFINQLVHEADIDAKLKIISGRDSSRSNQRRDFNRDKKKGGGKYRKRFQLGLSYSYNRKNSNGNSSKRSVSPISLKSLKIGAIIRQFSRFWNTITDDVYISYAVTHGISIPITSVPNQHFRKKNAVFSDPGKALCDLEVEGLLEKGTIHEIPEEQARFVCGIFFIPKGDGGHRPILNLKTINKFVKRIHSKMEGLPMLKDMVYPGDFFTYLDLKDAYLMVPVKEEHFQFMQLSR